MMGSVYKGGVAKFRISGESKWISKIPTYPSPRVWLPWRTVQYTPVSKRDNPVEYGEDTFSTGWERIRRISSLSSSTLMME